MKAWTFSLIVLGTACAPAPPRPLPSAARPPTVAPVQLDAPTPPPPRDDLALAIGEPRPEVRASIEIDASSLPVGKWGPPTKGSSFTMTTDPPEFRVGGSRYAEVSVGGFSAFTDTFVATTDWPCHRPGHATALWRGLSLDAWGVDGIKVVMSRGPYDFATCTAVPEATLVQRAREIVPGFVYGLRVDDSVYIVLPHASFAAATRNAAGSGPFSSATLPCVPHQEAAAVVRMSPVSLTGWQEISVLGPWANPWPADNAQNSGLLMIIVEVRARGDGNAIAVSAALPADTVNEVYAPFFAAMKRAAAPPG
jgi:hypothetical protein